MERLWSSTSVTEILHSSPSFLELTGDLHEDVLLEETVKALGLLDQGIPISAPMELRSLVKKEAVHSVWTEFLLSLRKMVASDHSCGQEPLSELDLEELAYGLLWGTALIVECENRWGTAMKMYCNNFLI